MTRQQTIRLSLPVLVLALVALFALTSRSGHSAGAASAGVPLAALAAATASPPTSSPTPSAAASSVTGDPILEIDTGTLTTYLASTTSGQGIDPGVDFRGVDLDGRLRKGSALGMHLAGNPIGPFPPGTQSIAGVTLMNGALTQEEVDLAFPADGPRWVIGRTYNARQDDGAHVSNGFQGKNWFQTAQPEIQAPDSSNRVYLFYGADRFIEFKLVSESTTTYKAVNGAAGAIVLASSELLDEGIPDLWTYTDQAGWEFTFFGFDDDGGSAPGQIWKIEAPSGEIAYVGDPDINNDPVTLGYNGTQMALAFDSEGRRYTFTYTTHDGVSRLDEVEVDIKDGGTWGSPTNLRTLGRVTYSYYSTESYGDPGDLKTVTIMTRLNNDGNELVREKIYQYFDGTFGGGNPGHPHSLRQIIDFEGVRQYDGSDSLFDGDHLGVAPTTLAPYASAAFEYDSNKRCIEVTSEGGCGGCGGGSAHGTVLFTYEANGSFSPITGYDTEWARRALAQRADGSFFTQYLDEVGQVLSHLITDATPASGTPSKWVTEVQRSSSGITTQVATPAAVTAYTHSTGTISSSNSAGLIRYWTPESSGATTGFALDQTYNGDLDSDKYLEWSRTFEVGSLVVGDTTVYRPLVDDEREYPVAITSGTSGSNLIARAYTWHSGTLSPKEITVTWPTVSTANNGSNSATTSRAWLDQVGRTVWTQAEDGVIDYTRYEGGLVTKSIRDADTTLTGGGQIFNGLTMPGWTLGSGPFHRIENTSYDDGFQRTVTRADERVLVSYGSVLADRRTISLTYSHFDSPTYFGPVEFSVMNHARRSEAQGRVALVDNEGIDDFDDHVDETDSDPLLALALGTVSRYRTSFYDKTGSELSSSRTYFDVPSSGEGTNGTHYDEEEYTYDSMGRQNRRELPHVGIPGGGTIYRTSFDVLGRVATRSIGTDDSGTGSDNMVVTELLEYDGGGDDGNSLLTERIARTTSDSSGERVTSYAHDVRGQVLLTTGASAPHSLVKYDNMGREIARGEFSSAPSASADPTSTTSGRMALSSSEFDERGRVMRSHFYNIAPSNGANTSSEKVTTDYWYDATGRTLKVEGEKLTKTFYDRLGRETHSFVLATTNDGFDSATYGKVDDVSGDIVLVEHQTVYENGDDDDVVMSVTIERFHDDYGGGETTGALDTNADNDRKLVTAGNLEGRAQITAMWHDDLGRLVDSVAFGTNGGSTLDRAALSSAPARSASALRTTYDYDDTGEQFSVVDPKGAEVRYGFDDAGRQTSVTQNYEDGTPESLEPDKDQIVRYGYTNGLRTTYTADLPSADQMTTYIHGTKRSGSSVEDSLIATSHLLYQVRYPDYDPTPGDPPVSDEDLDTITYAYNAQGDEIYRRDQDGTILEKTYDVAGRLTHDVASTLGTDIDDLGIGTDIDGAVRRKEFAYDGLGRMTTATQYNATTSGTLVDQVVHTYGEWGRMTSFALDVDSAVTGGSSIAAYTCSTDYTRSWAAVTPASRSGSRLVVPDSVTMPGGTFYSFVQDSTGYHEHAGRTSSVKDGVPTTVASFEFVGDRRVSKVALHLHDFVMDYADGASGGSYADWNQFNRVIEDEWVKDLATDRTFLDRKYAPDEGGFITEIYDLIEVDTSSNPTMDTLLALDGLNRLTGLQRGELNPSTHLISGESMEWTRALDVVGNMSNYVLDWTGDGDSLDADEYDTDLTFSAANEIDAIDTVAATYSRSGMLLDDLRLEYVYDAWGRIVEVKNATGGATLAYYRRNALDHLIGEQIDREPDSDIDGNDYWEYFLTRPSDMGMLASFRGSDDDPLVERLWLGDLESSATGSFYAPAVLERRDDNYDGAVDRDTVLFIDRTGSVMGNYGDDGSNGKQVERLHYNMTSQPFLMPWGDVDGDGDADANDESWIGTLWSFGWYDVRADLDLDGDVDSADYSAHAQIGGGVRVSNDANRLSAQALYAQYGIVHAVARSMQTAVGSWTTRDPLVYIDGPSAYSVVRNNALNFCDRGGLASGGAYERRDWNHRGTNKDRGDMPGTTRYGIGPNGGSIWVSNPASGGDFMTVVPSSYGPGAGVSDCHLPSCPPCQFNMHFNWNLEPVDREEREHQAPGEPNYDDWHYDGGPEGKFETSEGYGSPPNDTGSLHTLNQSGQAASGAGFPKDTWFPMGTSDGNLFASITVPCNESAVIVFSARSKPGAPKGRSRTAWTVFLFQCGSCYTYPPPEQQSY